MSARMLGVLLLATMAGCSQDDGPDRAMHAFAALLAVTNRAMEATAGLEYDAKHKEFVAQCQAERQEVLAAGGLYIMGTERQTKFVKKIRPSLYQD